VSGSQQPGRTLPQLAHLNGAELHGLVVEALEKLEWQ
jgi:hypothetical protein